MSNFKSIPKFENITQEVLFWQNNDSTNYINWADASVVSFPNLKPSIENISLNLSVSLLNEGDLY